MTGHGPGTFDAIAPSLGGPMIIVTTAGGGRRAGCLVGFATQAGIDPPRFLVCLSVVNRTYRVARNASHLAVQLTSPVLADFINDSFTKVWETALQVSNRKFESGTLLEDDEIQILRLLAAGQKDESVARALGVSVRTVQRKIQTLQRGFGAASRFQLGAISAKHLIVDRESAD